MWGVFPAQAYYYKIIIIYQRKKSGEERKTKIILYSYTVSLLNNFTAAFICKYVMLLNTYLHIIHSKRKKSRKKEWGRKKTYTHTQSHSRKRVKKKSQEKESRKRVKKKSQEKESRKRVKKKKTVGRKEKLAVQLKDLIPPEHLHTLFFKKEKPTLLLKHLPTPPHVFLKRFLAFSNSFFLIIAFFFKRNFLGRGPTIS